jgi:hypothetical protein
MGGLSPADLEGEAEAVYRRLGLDASDPADPVAIAEGLLGRDSVRSVRASALPGAATLVVVNGQTRIYVREKLSSERFAHLVGHEVAHFVLGPDATEQDCDYLGAAIIAPRPAMMLALRHVGRDWSELARIFGSTQTLAALRASEATGEPLALVAPRRVRVRGDAWAWPETEGEIRKLAKCGHSAIDAAQLTDEPRRVVMVVR